MNDYKGKTLNPKHYCTPKSVDLKTLHTDTQKLKSLLFVFQSHKTQQAHQTQTKLPKPNKNMN